MQNGILLCLFLFFTNMLCGQSVLTGRVLNEDKAPIAYANISLFGLEDPTIFIGGVTDDEGKFSLNLTEQGLFKLSISFIGFKDYINEIAVSENLDLGEIQLELNAIDIGDVVVTADRGVIERKGDQLVFNVARSPLKTGFDGLEILERSPNVFIGIAGEILIRNEIATILINGRPSNLVGEDLQNYISNLRSEDIWRIEVQTNFSANLQAASTGGAINIVLKESQKGFNATLRSDFGVVEEGFLEIYNGINATFGAEKWSIYGNYNFAKRQSKYNILRGSESIVTNILARSEIDSEVETNKHNYQVGSVVDLHQNHSVGLEIFGTINNRSAFEDGNMTIKEMNELLDRGKVLFENDRKSDLYNGLFNYSWIVDTLGSELKFYSDFSHQELEEFSPTVSSYTLGLFDETSLRNFSNSDTDIFSAQTDFTKKLKNELSFEAGVRFATTKRANNLLSESLINEEWLVNESSSSFVYDENIFAIYLLGQKKMNDGWFLKTGLRVENTDLNKVELQDTLPAIQQNYLDWFPSFYLSRDLTNNNLLSISYSKRLKRPSFNWLNNYVSKINDFSYFFGSPDLRPEYIHQYELGLKNKKHSYTLYYQFIEDRILSSYTIEENIIYSQRKNDGEQREVGAEYNYSGNFSKHWFAKISGAAFYRSFKDINNEKIFDQPGFTFNISNNFKINETTNIDLSGFYTSDYRKDYFEQFAYYSVNFMAQKSFLNKSLVCRLSFSDIFNILTFSNTREFETFSQTFANKPNTRGIKLSIRYNFTNKAKIRKGKNDVKNDSRKRL